MPLLADRSRELITFRDIEDVEIQKDLVTPHLQGHNMENFLTLHHLIIDALHVLTRERHEFLWIVEDLLWCSVPNSAEECSGIVVDLYDTTAEFCFLYPFLANDHNKTLNL